MKLSEMESYLLNQNVGDDRIEDALDLASEILAPDDPT
jgi:hypothetical protein